ncbi:adenosylmethionine-8-amino-7-oxononanoate aminotransferase [Neisseria arctica]|uniref:Adenosylmethionine-8-amino-7-oxononanoate aminotransferase n=1 Tax=Neisseria arctica TaxID=1470200 RepID=A0A0J1C2G7_9NEIS|nr:adenosylmethionine--8-amino-7-oxononanoate transaminase [Neisseria arctica]KLT72433.1 adenosylmethionine-8-amino-7-oxononanoate aminotransferase [Neisseria arctica]UOO85993.1 adenosylmethionine--8-amino-7-oxononanoate transaminase [Neisseria arctica]
MFSPQDLEFDRRHIWHPYTSMINPLPVYPVVRSEGVYLEIADGRRLVDGMSSWWCAQHGYNHPELVAAAKRQLDTMPHVMFGGITHEPAIRLCNSLRGFLPQSLECIFLADSGSVAVEVSLKMALQYWHAKGDPRTKFLTLERGYHGDTFGAMSVCDPKNSMHSLYSRFLPEHIFVAAPKSRFDGEWLADDIEAFQTALETHRHEIAAVILEPVVQGAGGMRIYHPEYLRQVRTLCDQYGILLILDEIATGFGRTGKMFACEHADISPDIICIGKALTGGMMTLSATAVTRKVAETVCSGEAGVFMHGPTFMGNPLACAVAEANMRILARNEWQAQVSAIEAHFRDTLMPLRNLENVADVRVVGAIGVVETRRPVDMAAMQAFFVKQGVWIRPFGRLVYLMPPYIVDAEQLRQLTDAVAVAVADTTLFAVS